MEPSHFFNAMIEFVESEYLGDGLDAMREHLIDAADSGATFKEDKLIKYFKLAAATFAIIESSESFRKHWLKELEKICDASLDVNSLRRLVNA